MIGKQRTVIRSGEWWKSVASSGKSLTQGREFGWCHVAESVACSGEGFQFVQSASQVELTQSLTFRFAWLLGRGRSLANSRVAVTVSVGSSGAALLGETEHFSLRLTVPSHVNVQSRGHRKVLSQPCR